MRKAFVFAGLAAATLSFVGCNKEADYAGNGTPFEIVLNTVDTRTVNNGMNTEWKENDALSVFYAPAGSEEWSANTKFTVSDTETGLAKGEVNLTESSYDWYLFYPYTSQIPNPKSLKADGSQGGYVYIGSGSSSSQKQAGLNSMAHLAGGDLPMVGVVKGVAASETPSVPMKHLTTVARINVTNATTAPVTITAVSLTAPENVVGTYYIDFSGNEPVITDSDNTHVGKTARLDVKDAEALEPGATASFYIAMKPFTAPVGSTLKVQVYAGAEVSESELTLTNAVTFQANHIKKLNVDYAPEAVEGKTLAEALELADDTDVTLVPLTVGAVSTKGYVVTDGTDGLYVYVGSTPSVKVGDVVKVTGKMASYYGVRQVASPSQTVVTEGDGTFEATWTDITANFESYTNTSSAPVKYDATVVKSNTYTNFKVEGAETFVGTLTNAPSAMFDGINEGDKVRVYGYFSTINNSSKLVGVYAYKLEHTGTSFNVELPGADESLSLTVPATTTSLTINVTGNVAWTASASDGASVDPVSGEGVGTVTVTFPANTDSTPKEYSVTVSTDNAEIIAAGDDEVVFNITQEAASGELTATIDFSEQEYTNGEEVVTATADGVTFTFDKGTNNTTPKYYNTGTAVRMYGSNTLTVAAAGKTITSIVFTFGSGDGTNPITASVPTYEEPAWTGEAGSVTFTIGGTTGQRRIKAITVKYLDSGSPAASLVSIAVSGQKTEFNVGDEFTHDTAKVTATYSDDTTKDVTASATFSSPDMTTAGTKEVTVTYQEGGITKEAKYDITVSAVDPDANTVSMTMTDYVTEHGCEISSGNDNIHIYKTLQLNPSVRMSTTGEPNCGAFYGASTQEWRLYQNKDGNVIITVANGCELKSVKLTYGTSNNGTLVDGAGNAVASNAVQTVSGSSVTYTVGNKTDATNGQVKITAVEVKYTGDGTTFPDNPDPQPTEIETKITMPNNANVYVGETIALNATSNVEGATITYESEDPAIATVNASGVVTGVAEGSVKVWARIAGVAGSYTSAEHYCTVTVATKPVQTDGTEVFIFSELGYANQADVTTVKGNNVTLVFDKGEGTNAPKYYTNGTNVRMYKNNTLTVSSEKTITKIEFFCTDGYGIHNEATFSTGTCSNDVWEGSAKSVELVNATSGTTQIRFTSIKVTYE